MNARMPKGAVAVAAALALCGGCDKPQPVPQAADGPRITGAKVVPGEPTLRLDQGPADAPRPVFLVEGLGPDALEALRAADLDRDAWVALFAVQVGEAPPLLGRYDVAEASIRFEPKYPPEPGLRVRATYDPARLPGRRGRPATGPITAEFEVAARSPKAGKATELAAIFPTRSTLPANQLKLYLQFSGSMARGGSYRHVRLIDESTREDVEMPFLELDEELWDADQRRLTLIFDPARVKRGLASREEAGPILVDGRSYTLIVDPSWEDADGRPLAREARKAFRVGPLDESPVDPAQWAIRPPAAGTRDPLVVTFPEPLDRGLLAHAIRPTDEAGFPRKGTVAIDAEETRWAFTPETPWQAGPHALLVDSTLEDLAGNTVGRPFEIDIFEKVDQTPIAETTRVSFAIE